MVLAFGFNSPAIAQDSSFAISVVFGPTAEVPDPRVGYNGWMSNQTDVAETLMGIDYDLFPVNGGVRVCHLVLHLGA